MLSGLQSSVLLIVPIWGNDITALTNTKQTNKQKTQTNKQNPKPTSKTKHLGTQIQHPCPP